MHYLKLTAINDDNYDQCLRDLKDSLDMSPSDLSKILGVSRSTITRLEAKITKPSDDFFNRLKALNVIGWHQVQKKDPSAIALLKKHKIREDTLQGPEIEISNIYVAIGILAIAGIDLFNNKIGISDNIVTYAVLQGTKKILDANNLVLKKLGNVFEIVSNKIKGEGK